MLRIDFEIFDACWVECTLSREEESFTISGTDLGDPLGDLVLGTVAMLGGFNEVSFSFTEEPGEYRWRVTRISPGELRVGISRSLKFESFEPEQSLEKVGEITCGVLEFGRAVRQVCDQLLASFGEAGYRKAWPNNPFPIQTCEILNAYIDRLLPLEQSWKK